MKRRSAHQYTRDELLESLPPIASLISKSEKARRKLAAGTWQHTMLGDRLRALRIASALMKKATGDTHRFTRDRLQEAQRTITSLIPKTQEAQAQFAVGTSQNTLQRNRLKALRTALALVNLELKRG